MFFAVFPTYNMNLSGSGVFGGISKFGSLLVNTLRPNKFRKLTILEYMKSVKFPKFRAHFSVSTASKPIKLGTNRLQILCRCQKWCFETRNFVAISSYARSKYDRYFYPLKTYIYVVGTQRVNV